MIKLLLSSTWGCIREERHGDSLLAIEAIMNVALRAYEEALSWLARAYVAVAWQGYRLYAFTWRTRSLTYKQLVNGFVFGGTSLLLVGAIYLNTLHGGLNGATLLSDLFLFCGVVSCWLLLAHFDSCLRKRERQRKLLRFQWLGTR